MTEATGSWRKETGQCIGRELAKFADEYKKSADLAFHPFFSRHSRQTVGKRNALDAGVLSGSRRSDYVLGSMKLLGLQGNNRDTGKAFGTV